MTLIAKGQERSSHYVAVLNGRWYRIDGDMNSSVELFRTGTPDWHAPPAQVPAASRPETAVDADLPAARRDAVPAETAASVTIQAKRSRLRIITEDAGAEMQQNRKRPFNRDSADSLRAGHPDLWNLLVAGTCLEGSMFERA